MGRDTSVPDWANLPGHAAPKFCVQKPPGLDSMKVSKAPLFTKSRNGCVTLVVVIGVD